MSHPSYRTHAAASDHPQGPQIAPTYSGEQHADPAVAIPWEDGPSEFAPDIDSPIAVGCPIATAPTIEPSPLAVEDLPELEPHTVGALRAGLLLHPSGSRCLLEFQVNGADPVCVPLSPAQARVMGTGLLKLADEADAMNVTAGRSAS